MIALIMILWLLVTGTAAYFIIRNTARAARDGWKGRKPIYTRDLLEMIFNDKKRKK